MAVETISDAEGSKAVLVTASARSKEVRDKACKVSMEISITMKQGGSHGDETRG